MIQARLRKAFPTVSLAVECQSGAQVPVLFGPRGAGKTLVLDEFKTPVLLVTNDLEECFELGEEMIVMREGRIVQSGAPRKILDQPANLEVARLLGAFNLIPAEIRTLDPSRNVSRVQIGEHEIEGPYFPGHFKGDRVTVCVRPDQLIATPRNGKPSANQVPAMLERAIEQPHGMRLEFN